MDFVDYKENGLNYRLTVINNCNESFMIIVY